MLFSLILGSLERVFYIIDMCILMNINNFLLQVFTHALQSTLQLVSKHVCTRYGSVSHHEWMLKWLKERLRGTLLGWQHLIYLNTSKRGQPGVCLWFNAIRSKQQKLWHTLDKRKLNLIPIKVTISLQEIQGWEEEIK